MDWPLVLLLRIPALLYRDCERLIPDLMQVLTLLAFNDVSMITELHLFVSPMSA